MILRRETLPAFAVIGMVLLMFLIPLLIGFVVGLVVGLVVNSRSRSVLG